MPLLRRRSAIGPARGGASRDALKQAEADVERAVDILGTRGEGHAARRAGTTAGEGVIRSYIDPGNRIGVLI